MAEHMTGNEHMFAYRIGRFKGLLRPASLLAFAALTSALLGCGGGDQVTDPTPTSDEGPTAGADAEDLQVIEDWSRTLSDGDVEGAAGYFAVPSTAENGGLRIDIRSSHDAIAFNESLPCGAEVIAADTDGDVTTATFRLADRPGGDCGSGAGGEAATAFRIEDGEIVDWQRVGVAGGGAEPPGGDGVVPGGGGAGAPV